MRPRLQSSACARPLNFTVRSHWGNWGAAKNEEIPLYLTPQWHRRQRTRESCARPRSTQPGARAAASSFDRGRGARADRVC